MAVVKGDDNFQAIEHDNVRMTVVKEKTATIHFVSGYLYTVRFLNYDGEVLQETRESAGTMPVYAGETPVKPDDYQHVYTFQGWLPVITPVTHDIDYTAQFNEIPITYTIRFLNYDGTVLQTSEVLKGVLPVYEGSTPTKPSDSLYSYTFDGWDTEVSVALADKDYTATFESVPIPHPDGMVIEFKDYGALSKGYYVTSQQQLEALGFSNRIKWGPGSEWTAVGNFFDGEVNVGGTYKHFEGYLGQYNSGGDYYSSVNLSKQIAVAGKVLDRVVYDMGVFLSPKRSSNTNFYFTQIGSTLKDYGDYGYTEFHAGTRGIYWFVNHAETLNGIGQSDMGEIANSNWNEIKECRIQVIQDYVTRTVTTRIGDIDSFHNDTDNWWWYETTVAMNGNWVSIRDKMFGSGATLNATAIGGNSSYPVGQEYPTYQYGYVSGFQYLSYQVTARDEYDYYTIRFENRDGTLLQESQVREALTPSYTGATPTRPDDTVNHIRYVFNGWSPSVGIADQNQTYTAQYSTITYMDDVDIDIDFRDSQWRDIYAINNTGLKMAISGTTPVNDTNYYIVPDSGGYLIYNYIGGSPAPNWSYKICFDSTLGIYYIENGSTNKLPLRFSIDIPANALNYNHFRFSAEFQAGYQDTNQYVIRPVGGYIQGITQSYGKPQTYFQGYHYSGSANTVKVNYNQNTATWNTLVGETLGFDIEGTISTNTLTIKRKKLDGTETSLGVSSIKDSFIIGIKNMRDSAGTRINTYNYLTGAGTLLLAENSTKRIKILFEE